ncbi:Mrp/NBP35 family ATP-binding protein [Croceibacterium mercuriale]|uniref:Mrp/NBP35 family ATP-binding protein n=1 Tax=Croceibacterium mercuriale TaxID=1572751 RepID=UPI000690122D|nr:Mrp/NBP35 family ATP-binding protein [Croceibacterium mercuriale]
MTPIDPRSDHPIARALPAEAQGRIRTLRLADGVVTLIVDAAGLERGAAGKLQAALEQAVGAVPDVSEVRVALMADRVERQIIVVGSGKGGVGKSTLTANLAVALSRLGLKVGVVDADIYGPSQPTLLHAEGTKPTATGQQLNPVDCAWGLKMLSMGQLIEPGKAIAWRGPMVGNALAQMMDAAWGDTEVLLVDLPPGTGDVQLTMLQKFRPSAAVIVSTPQDLALIDATRALDLFRTVGVPVAGMVENMAGYVCPHCGEISDPFGRGGAEATAAKLDLPFLGRVPLAMEIRVASDAGQPPAATDGPQGDAFRAVALRLAEWMRG